MNDALIQVPGTNFVVLKNDTALSAWAMKSGSIVGEKYIFDLPEVKALGPGDICIDAGALVGDTCLPLLEKGCEVYAFEAYRDSYEALRINCPTAHSFNVILGDGRPARADGIYGESNGNAGTRMVTPGVGEPTFCIDSLNLPKVTYAKIDVESFELPVLIGMRKTIDRCKPFILVELYDSLLRMNGFNRQEIIDYIEGMGYSWRVAIGRWQDDRVDIICHPNP